MLKLCIRMNTAGALLLLLPMNAFSTTIDDYLLQASNRALVQGLNSGAVNSESWSSSWVDSSEFRIGYEEDENDISSETYRLRMRPKYGSEREAEQTLYSVSTQQHHLHANKVLASDLLQRYFNIIDILSMQLAIKHFQNKLELLQFEIDAERALSQGKRFDAEKMQGLVLNMDRSSTQFDLSKKRFDRVVNNLNLTLDDQVFLNSLISPALILSTMQQYKTLLDNTKALPVVRLAQLDKNIAGARLKIEQSKQGFGVELLEVKYEDKENSSVGFTLGFRLPSGNNARSLQRHLDQSKADSKFRLTSNDVRAMLLKKRTDIDWQYAVWLADQQALEKIGLLMQQPARAQNPALLIGLRQQQLSLNKNLNDTHIRLLRNYVELLNVSGLLSQHPLKNWLHAGLPALAHL